MLSPNWGCGTPSEMEGVTNYLQDPGMTLQVAMALSENPDEKKAGRVPSLPCDQDDDFFLTIKL